MRELKDLGYLELFQLITLIPREGTETLVQWVLLFCF